MAERRVQAVIWDVGGVLLRTDDRQPRTALGARFGLTYDEIDRAVFGSPSAHSATLGLISDHDHWQQVFNNLGVAADAQQQFVRDFWAGDRLDEVLVSFIRGLRPHFRTGLLSNAWSDGRKNVEKNYRFLDIFDVAVFSAEVKLAKPDPKIYELALAKLAVNAEEAVFVDDVSDNIEAARAVGMHGIQFKTVNQVLSELKALLNTGVAG